MQSVRVEMNYLKVYCNLIRKAEKRTPPEGYIEKHHTFPKSIFGKNNRIVVLTAREHYIAHALLEKICIKKYGLNHWKTKKMINAFWAMNNQENELQKRYFNSKLYEGAKLRFNILNKNYRHTEETIKKFSATLKNLGDKHPARSNNEWKKKRQDYMKENNPMNNPKSVQKLCKFQYEIVNPEGKIFIVDNMRKFCRENNLGHSPMFALISGKKKYYKGWTGEKLSTN